MMFWLVFVACAQWWLSFLLEDRKRVKDEAVVSKRAFPSQVQVRTLVVPAVDAVFFEVHPEYAVATKPCKKCIGLPVGPITRRSVRDQFT